MSNVLTAGKPVIEAIKLAHAANQPVLLEGPHGIGKSQLIEQAAKQMNMSFIVRDLSLMEPPDLIGLPEKHENRTRYLTPDFLPKTGKGLLAFEELNRAEKYMMAPCLQLLTARCLNDYKLPPGWLPVAAINPEEDGYDVNELDPALLSRFIRIRMKASSAEWLTWAQDNDIHSAVQNYVKVTKGVFDASNPRSWTYVSNLLKAFEKGGMHNRSVLSASISGLVGNTHASAFWIKYSGNAEATLSPDDILRNYKNVGKTVREWRTKKETGLISGCVHAVRTALQDSDLCREIAGTPAMTKALKEFIDDLPGDLGKEVRADARRNKALK